MMIKECMASTPAASYARESTVSLRVINDHDPPGAGDVVV
jgi:hypothetical protein